VNESRRRFYASFWKHLVGIAGALEGRKPVRPQDLRCWPQAHVAALRPRMSPEICWDVEERALCVVRGRDAVLRRDLSPVERATVVYFRGELTLDAIAAAVAAAGHGEVDACFAIARALFIELAEAWLCFPVEVGVDNGGEEDGGG
jgi:hypothetical protein